MTSCQLDGSSGGATGGGGPSGRTLEGQYASAFSFKKVRFRPASGMATGEQRLEGLRRLGEPSLEAMLKGGGKPSKGRGHGFIL
jgi:hypothetical protein